MLLKQWFSTGADSVPQGYLAMSGDNLGCKTWGGGCYWYLVSGGQGSLITRNANSAEVGNLALKRQKVREWQKHHNCIWGFKEISSEVSLINIASKWLRHVHGEERPRTLLVYFLCFEQKKQIIDLLPLSFKNSYSTLVRQSVPKIKYRSLEVNTLLRNRELRKAFYGFCFTYDLHLVKYSGFLFSLVSLQHLLFIW